jgi:hypothetical protein
VQDTECVNALWFARLFLLGSAACYALVLFVIGSGTSDAGLWFLIGILANLGIMIGALACVVVQIAQALARRRTRSSRQAD